MASVNERVFEYLAGTQKPEDSAKREEKKNYAEGLSRFFAELIADELRTDFPTTLPKEDGTFHESSAGSARGVKKLDVNVSTPELGLALGVSIKTISFHDPKTKNYKKNLSRNDNELRAEAADYHVRQPYSVLVGVLFLPLAAALDAKPRSPDPVSSFAAAVKYFRMRSGRTNPTDEPDRFEAFYIALYESRSKSTWLKFFDVDTYRPPKYGPPREDTGLEFKDFLSSVKLKYQLRNDPPFEYDEPTT